MEFKPNEEQMAEVTGKQITPASDSNPNLNQSVVSPSEPVQNYSPSNDFMPEIMMKMNELPSQGKAYPQGSSIKYRPYRYGEVKKINQSRLSAKQQFLTILEGITVTGFNALELSLEDTMYLAILRKISTINDSKVMVKYYCKGCKKWGDFTIPSGSIEFYDLTLPDLPIRADFSIGELHFAPLTLKRYFEILDAGEDYDNDIAYSAGTCVNKSFKAAYNLFYQLEKPEDVALLDQIDTHLKHGIKPLDHVCAMKVKVKGKEDKVCNTKLKVGLDGGQALLLPFRQRKVDVKSRIHFGHKRGN